MPFLSRTMLASVVLGGLLSTGCRDHITAGLVLVLRSEMAVPADLDDVEVQVSHRERGEELRFDIPLGGPQGFFLPATHAITPSQSKRPGPYTFRAVGKLKGRARVVYDFVADIPLDRVSTVEVPLQFLCYDQTRVLADGQTVGLCPQGQTCIAGECKPIPVYDGKSLPSYDPKELGLDPSATCYDAGACFASPLFLLPDMATCRVPRPASGNLTIGLLLPLTKPGLPYFGRKLVVFDSDGLAGYSAAGNEIQLPTGICNVMRSDPNILLLGSTICASKKERDPLCRLSSDAAGPLLADLGLPIDDVGSAADVYSIDGSNTPDGPGADVSGLHDGAPTDSADSWVPDSTSSDAVQLDVADDHVQPLGECETDQGFRAAGAACSGGVCNGTGRCIACLLNSTRCEGRTPQTCTTESTWSSGSECQTACLNGSCIECVPNTRRCRGSTPELCSLAGAWQPESPCATACIGDGVCRIDNATCWGSNSSEQASPPVGTFLSISVAVGHGCAIRDDRSVSCWGDDTFGRATPAVGSFQKVSVGDYHGCALRTEGGIACWGSNLSGQSTPKTGTYTTVSAGGSHTCAIRADQAVSCWGRNDEGQSTVPSGAFTSLAAGAFHTCAVRTDGAIICWGSNSSGQATPPAGAYTIVAAGSWHTCALRSDGTAACWGRSAEGQTTPPAGPFTALTAGAYHTCGLHHDGTVTCWGRTTEGQSTAPSGNFSAIAAGSIVTCALRR